MLWLDLQISLLSSKMSVTLVVSVLSLTTCKNEEKNSADDLQS